MLCLLLTEFFFIKVQVKVEPGDLDGLDVYIKQEPNNKTTADNGDLSDIREYSFR